MKRSAVGGVDAVMDRSGRFKLLCVINGGICYRCNFTEPIFKNAMGPLYGKKFIFKKLITYSIIIGFVKSLYR